MENNMFLFSKVFGFVIGAVVCECLLGLSASILFGLFENKIDYIKKTGPIGFAGFLTGVFYFFLCYFVTKLIFIFAPADVAISEFAVWFNYASWAIMLTVFAGKGKSAPMIGLAVIFGYFISDILYLTLTH